MAITITVQDEGISRYLQQLNARLADLSPVMDSIGHALEQNIRQRYQSRKDPNGNAWKDWAPDTKKTYPWRGSKAAKGKNGPGRGKILERYGHMFDSLSYTYDKTNVSIGFAVPYAAYHEWGTKRMPRRGLLTANPATGELGAQDQKTVLQVLQRHLQP